MIRTVIKTVLMAVIMAVFLAGCKNDASSEAKEQYTFTDDLGRKVSVNHPQRVAALLGSYAHIWHFAGGSGCSKDRCFQNYRDFRRSSG